MSYDPLEELLSREVMTQERVLELVDEYQLLSFYLQHPFELRTAYHSPFRDDEKKSFSLFEATTPGMCEFLWKDSGNGKVGNVFTLVQLLYSLSSKQEVFKKIDRDFQLNLFPGNTCACPITPKIYYEKPPPKGPAQIRVKVQPFTKQGLRYWEEFGVGASWLSHYRVSQLQYFWTRLDQVDPFAVKGLGFSYQLGDRYKLYQPYNEGLKFLNNLAPYMVEGWLQLTPGKGDLVVITKSTKDCLVLRSFGIEAVSPRSESTPILPRQLELLEERFKKVVVWFDNDFEKEVNVGQELAKKYPYPSVMIPTHFKQKDVSDFRKAYGPHQTQQLINQLLNP